MTPILTGVSDRVQAVLDTGLGDDLTGSIHPSLPTNGCFCADAILLTLMTPVCLLLLLALVGCGSAEPSDSSGTCAADPAVVHGSRSAEACEVLGPAGTPAGAREPQEQYIVRFKEYMHAEEHRMQLDLALPGQGSAWRWVPRLNKAADHPTDFGLVSIASQASSSVDRMLAMLSSVAGVKDVHK